MFTWKSILQDLKKKINSPGLDGVFATTAGKFNSALRRHRCLIIPLVVYVLGLVLYISIRRNRDRQHSTVPSKKSFADSPSEHTTTTISTSKDPKEFRERTIYGNPDFILQQVPQLAT
jgi:hypothetical protein